MRFTLLLFILLGLGGSLFSQQKHAHYYVTFSARDVSVRPFSLGGHAFVSWGYVDTGIALISEKTLGFFPSKESNMLEEMVARRRGRVVRGYFSNGKGLFLRNMTIEVDSAVWWDTQCEGDIWNYQPYNLFTRNCVHFLDNVVKITGLRRPRTYTWLFHLPMRPVKYTRKLRRKNKRKAVYFRKMHFDQGAGMAKKNK